LYAQLKKALDARKEGRKEFRKNVGGIMKKNETAIRKKSGKRPPRGPATPRHSVTSLTKMCKIMRLDQESGGL